MMIKEQFYRLFRNEMPEKEARDFLVGLYQKGEDSQDIEAAVSVMREFLVPLPLVESLRNEVFDVVGTGGDGSGTFNISSTAAIMLASMGVPVAKHGNRSVTSQSGSADILEALGINLNLSIQSQTKMLEACGFVYLFALSHHPAMRHITPVRKSLPHRTIFNILGPLVNPAGCRKQLLGVFSVDYIERIAKAAQKLNYLSCMIVSSLDGLDEASVSAPTRYAKLSGDRLEYGEIQPQTLGFSAYALQEVKGGTPKENAAITLGIFKNEIQGAKRDIVLLNSALAFWTHGSARDLQDGIAMAKESLASGKALAKLEEIRQLSTKL